MAAHYSAPLGAPCWIDLMSLDTDKSIAFYSDLFGWRAEQGGAEYGGYISLYQGDAIVAGLMRNEPDSEFPDGWTTYLSSSDIHATTDAAVKAAGTILLPPMDVVRMGAMAIISDPGGASVGVWEPKEHTGFTAHGTAGTPFWHELHTRDYPAVVPFYQNVFGWQTEITGDTDEFRYTVQVSGPDQFAGIMDARGFLPEGVPSNWQVYFGSADVDATLERIVELGGTVVEKAEDTPFGRLAGATDPNGARFKLSSLTP
jgi:predicted enzyme related to lactoylglutathione lyase